MRKIELLKSIKENMIVNLAGNQKVLNPFVKFKTSTSNTQEVQALIVRIDLTLNEMTT